MDPDARLHYADDILRRAADQVAALLAEAAQALRPFPPFPGAFFTFGIEVDAPGVQDRNLGCIVVTETGDLRELQIGFDEEAGALGPPDPVAMRDERLVTVEIRPHDRLLLAYEGLRLVTRELARRRVGGAGA